MPTQHLLTQNEPFRVQIPYARPNPGQRVSRLLVDTRLQMHGRPHVQLRRQRRYSDGVTAGVRAVRLGRDVVSDVRARFPSGPSGRVDALRGLRPTYKRMRLMSRLTRTTMCMLPCCKKALHNVRRDWSRLFGSHRKA